MVFQPDEIKLMDSALDEVTIILPDIERTAAMKAKLASRILAAARGSGSSARHPTISRCSQAT